MYGYLQGNNESVSVKQILMGAQLTDSPIWEEAVSIATNELEPNMCVAQAPDKSYVYMPRNKISAYGDMNFSSYQQYLLNEIEKKRIENDIKETGLDLNERVTLYNIITKEIRCGFVAPKRKNLAQYLHAHPQYRVYKHDSTKIHMDTNR